MEKSFLARQPIFDRELNVYGYEILCRSGPENVCTEFDGNKATSQVIDGTMHSFGFAAITSDKKAFINVTHDMLIDDMVGILPKEHTILEILESVPVDDALLAAAKHYHDQGFKLALDDFSFKPGIEKVFDLIDIVKIDYRATTFEERLLQVKKLSEGRRIQFLAEKVESILEFNEAKRLGFAYFQGYFFAKPESLERKEIPPHKLNYLRFLREVNRMEINYDDLEGVIKQEMSLSVRLLRYINSAMFGLRHKIDSIKRALAYLGERNIRRWSSVLAMIDMAEDKPHELIVTALTRARFCERLGEKSGLKERASDLFLMGLVSTLDAILDQPMEEILQELPLAEDVKEAITGGVGDLSRILQMVTAYERGFWGTVNSQLDEIQIEQDAVPALFEEAVTWTDRIFQVNVTA